MELTKKQLEDFIYMKATRSFDVAYSQMQGRGWDRLYVLVDLHATVLLPNYRKGHICREFYPMAKEVLQMLSKRKDIVLIMFTSSFPNEIVEYLEMFEQNGIHFKYANKNPEVSTSECGYFEVKPYMNVLLDDKASFMPEIDWLMIDRFFRLKNNEEIKSKNNGGTNRRVR